MSFSVGFPPLHLATVQIISAVLRCHVLLALICLKYPKILRQPYDHINAALESYQNTRNLPDNYCVFNAIYPTFKSTFFFHFLFLVSVYILRAKKLQKFFLLVFILKCKREWILVLNLFKGTLKKICLSNFISIIFFPGFLT